MGIIHATKVDLVQFNGTYTEDSDTTFVAKSDKSLELGHFSSAITFNQLYHRKCYTNKYIMDCTRGQHR